MACYTQVNPLLQPGPGTILVDRALGHLVFFLMYPAICFRMAYYLDRLICDLLPKSKFPQQLWLGVDDAQFA